MKRTTLAAARKRQPSRPASRNHRRVLRCELLERRELLAVGLAGVQSVGLWQMALDISHATNQGEILSQTAANFTLTGSSQQARQNVSVNWGDGTASSDDLRLHGHGVRQPYVFVGRVYRHGDLRSGTSPAIGSIRGRSPWARLPAPSPTDSVFIVDNSGVKQVYAQHGQRKLQVYVTNPYCMRSFSSRSVAAIYGSLTGSTAA